VIFLWIYLAGAVITWAGFFVRAAYLEASSEYPEYLYDSHAEWAAYEGAFNACVWFVTVPIMLMLWLFKRAVPALAKRMKK
jgi:hypothetical protein